jgi:Ca-activated chloride channel family protein
VFKKFQAILLSAIVVIFAPLTLLGDGLIIIDPLSIIFEQPARLNVAYHHVAVSIDHQVATTNVDQVFENPYDVALEGTYIFPVPAQACIHNFTLRVNGTSVTTNVLTKEEAHAEYESLVKKHKDAALLEFIGRDMVKAHISSIPARQKIRVNIEYTELLTAQNGTIKYHYTLGTEKFSAKILDDVSVTVTIKAPQTITNVYSPTHKIALKQLDKNACVASYEEKDVRPLRDFILYYTMPQDEIGFNVVTYKDGTDDGFFLAMMSPHSVDTSSHNKAHQIVPKNIVFVVDRSGSMYGEKIQQAKQALNFCLTNLNPHDHFNIISFDDAIDMYQSELVAATSKNIKSAQNYVDALHDRGCTDINKALLQALQQLPISNNPNIIIFLTDGEPTSGECDISKIIKNTKHANATNVRLFSFGVGYDVNTTLLDKISLDNKGTSDYIEPQENIESKVSSFYLKVANPFLTDLELAFSGAHVKEIYPVVLPDLFYGSQLLVVGRYTRGGAVQLNLMGEQSNIHKQYIFASHFATQDTHNDFLPRIWAQRKIAHLVDQVVLEGKAQNIVDEIITLSRMYGIITEYTSFLVGADAQTFTNKSFADTMKHLTVQSLSFASSDQSGYSSVSRAKEQQKSRSTMFDTSDQTNALYGAKETIRTVGARTFYLKDNVWIDAQHTDASPIIKIKLFSDAYFDLVRKSPEFGACLALGNQVIIKTGSSSVCIDNKQLQ